MKLLLLLMVLTFGLASCSTLEPTMELLCTPAGAAAVVEGWGTIYRMNRLPAADIACQK